MEIYAEKIIRARRKEPETEAEEFGYGMENDGNRGFIVVKYQKMEVEEREVLGGRLRMLLPKTFAPMPEWLLGMKYPDPDRPEWIYSDEEGEVTLTFHWEEGELAPGELKEAVRLIGLEMKRLSPSSVIEAEEALGDGPCPVFWFSLDLPLLDELCWHVMFFCEAAGGLVMGTFDCASEDKKQWKPVVRQLLETIEETGQEEEAAGTERKAQE